VNTYEESGNKNGNRTEYGGGFNAGVNGAGAAASDKQG
jgi:hypothetical protein